MIRIKNKSTNPYFNLALEEYALKYINLDEPIIILWQNEPSVIIGRNQNTIEEINGKYIKDHHIHVVRRLSGGGAVYHDLGNLNFTFITKKGKEDIRNFEKFTRPVIETLKDLEVPASFTGRNDITIEDKKFSGNAQYMYKDRLLHHGTILFDAELSVVQEALNVKIDKIESKGIKSVRSRVTNIAPYLKAPMNLGEFQSRLISTMFSNAKEEPKEYLLKTADLDHIKKIMEERYLKWEWNYGESPAFNLQKARRYVGGILDIRMDVKDGFVKGCRIYGDYFGQEDTLELAEGLLNCRFEESDIRSLLNHIDFSKYFLNISKEDFIDCLFY